MFQQEQISSNFSHLSYTVIFFSLFGYKYGLYIAIIFMFLKSFLINRFPLHHLFFFVLKKKEKKSVVKSKSKFCIFQAFHNIDYVE